MNQDHTVTLLSNKLKNKNIALLISGSIAAYQTCDLCRLLRKNGAIVQVFTSPEALNFVSLQSLEWASGNKVFYKNNSESLHLNYASFDLFLFAPASYNSINKLNNGISDNLLTLTLAVALTNLENNKVPLLIYPTMHLAMNNSILKNSLKNLQSKGAFIGKSRKEEQKNKLPLLDNIVQDVILNLQN